MICFKQGINIEVEGTQNFQAKLANVSDSQVGGVHVLPDRMLQLYGNAKPLFILDLPVEVHKFSIMSFSLNAVKAPVSSFFVCLYEDKSGVEENETIVGNEYRCTNVTNYGNVEVRIGIFFENRMTEINAISFAQFNDLNPTSERSDVMGITFRSDDKEPIFNSFGECNDIHAFAIQIDGTLECMCTDQFVASNGGRVLGEYDSCVACLGCALDGESCNVSRDCMMGTCTPDNVCVPGVSATEFIIA